MQKQINLMHPILVNNARNITVSHSVEYGLKWCCVLLSIADIRD